MGHAFHQGPKTSEMNLMMTTCETINESMLQLVLQVSTLVYAHFNQLYGKIFLETMVLAIGHIIFQNTPGHHCPLEWWSDR